MNQREIKFRAWDEKKKAIRDVTAINWYDEYLWVDETPMTGDKLPIESTPLMQYTGLKDRNGKDLYEGDIVHIRDGTSENAGQEVWTVEYDNSKASFSVFNQLNSIRYFSDDPECLFRDCPIVEVTEDLVWHPEILGNIYEGLATVGSGNLNIYENKDLLSSLDINHKE